MQEKLFQPLGFFQGFWRYASYEFRTSFKPLCVTYALGFLFLCLLKLDMSFYNSTLENMIYTSLVILCVGFFLAFLVILVVWVWQSFWGEVFGDEGYLTHTLPIGLHCILLPKILLYTLWSFCALVGFVIGITFVLENESLSYILSYFATLKICGIIMYFITFILVICAILNVLRVRRFVLMKALLLAIIFFLPKMLLEVFGLTFFLLVVGDSVKFLVSYFLFSDFVWAVLFYTLAYYLISRKLELA